VTRITGTLHVEGYTFMNVSRLVFLRMRNISKLWGKSKHNFNYNTSSSEIRAVYDIMWKNMVEPYRPQIRSARFWYITQRKIASPYRRFRNKLMGFLTHEDETDRLSRNIGKELPLYAV